MALRLLCAVYLYLYVCTGRFGNKWQGARCEDWPDMRLMTMVGGKGGGEGGVGLGSLANPSQSQIDAAQLFARRGWISLGSPGILITHPMRTMTCMFDRLP